LNIKVQDSDLDMMDSLMQGDYGTMRNSPRCHVDLSPPKSKKNSGVVAPEGAVAS